MTAFGAEPQALASLPGFYVTYGSIYVTLLGRNFAGLLGAKRLEVGRVGYYRLLAAAGAVAGNVVYRRKDVYAR